MTACYTNRLSVVKVLLEAPNIKYNHQGKV
ncbi:hypothetical protein EON65_22955 [archaeon]|nr:MAG: hypothetical protein EON65_22955 [archaeon]